MSLLQQAVHKVVISCKDGHCWVATIITGYFLCSRCHAMGACVVCVPHARGNPKQGYCMDHQHLRPPETAQEVFA